MTQIIIDTVVLRVMSFAHPQGIEIMLDAINVSCGRFPTEVYNRDEDSLPLKANDEELSELARGLRYAQRYQVQAVFLSSDDKACEVANELKIPHLTLPDILEAWVQTKKPPPEELDTLIQGMANAQFRLKRSFEEQLRQRL